MRCLEGHRIFCGLFSLLCKYRRNPFLGDIPIFQVSVIAVGRRDRNTVYRDADNRPQEAPGVRH